MLNKYDMKKLVPILIFSFFTINCLKAKKSPFDISSPSGLFGVGILTSGINQSNGSGSNTNEQNTEVPSFTVSGSISGFTQSSMTLSNDGKDESNLNPTNTYSFKVQKDSSFNIIIKSNPSGFACSIVNANGIANANITNANITCLQITTPKLVYSPGNWNDYVKNDGTDRLTASSSTCDGTETGNYYQSCIHAGEIRKIEIPNKSSCTGLTIADNASSGGALNWICKEDSANNQLVIYSTNLRKGKYLSDLIDWSLSIPDWKQMKLVVTEGTSTLFESTPSKWWTNQIVNNEDTAFVSGAIHTYTASQLDAAPINVPANLNFLSLNVSKMSLVAKPGLTMFRSVSNSSILLQANIANLKFVWIEGVYDANNNDGGIAIGSSTKFLVLKNLVIQNSSQSSGTPNNPAIALSGQKNLIEDVKIMNGKHQGISLINTATNNLILNFTSANNVFNGIHLGTSGTSNFFLNILTANNEPRGILLQSGSNDNHFMNVTTINNNASGLMFFTNCNQNFIGNILSLNNATSGLENSGSNNNTIYNQISSNNNTSAISPQLVSTTASYSGNVFTGLFKVSGLNNIACNALGTPAGIGFTNTCAQEGASDFVSSFSIDVLTGILAGNGGKSSSDSANSSFATGTATYATTLNWNSFENNFRFIGKAGGAFPDLTNTQRGKCITGDTCQMWDASLKQSDTIARNVNSCPTSSSTITHNSITFLRGAYEILGDFIGDEDGLCESNESCIYTPNIGAYQGHGSIIPASQVTSSTNKCNDLTTGTISNVKLYKFETNGY